MYYVFLRLSKISQKADYLTKGSSCTQYKSVYTGKYWVYQHTYKLDSVYLIIYLYEQMSTAARPYIRVQTLCIWVQVSI